AQQYREIMIDEYQDSNFIQEALLSAVSGEEDGIWNRFMVGDIKQSIYGFRLARPELFLEKYRTYQREDEAETEEVRTADEVESEGKNTTKTEARNVADAADATEETETEDKRENRRIRQNCRRIDLHRNF